MFVDCGNSARCTDFQTLNLQHLGFLERPCYCNQCQFSFIDFFVKTFLMFVYKRSFPICVTMISAGYSALLTSARLGRVGSNKLLLLSTIIFQTGGPVAFPCQVDHWTFRQNCGNSRSQQTCSVQLDGEVFHCRAGGEELPLQVSWQWLGNRAALPIWRRLCGQHKGCGVQQQHW